MSILRFNLFQGDLKYHTDISSEMKSMQAELEQNKSLCLESRCRLELMKRQNVLKWKFSIFKVSFARTAPS